MKNLYIKYKIRYNDIYNIIDALKVNTIIFYIDILSIAKGFYNKSTVSYEVSHYLDTKKPPDFFINEMRGFLNNLYKRFDGLSRKFILFYDYGICKQNKSIDKSYKATRGRAEDYYLLDNQELELMRQIRNYYLQKSEEVFTKPGLSTVINTKEFESDFIPHYVISNNLLPNIQQTTILNVILSHDKDLLQTTEFPNTIQYISRYLNKNLLFELYHRDNAISYFYKKFKRGILTAKYVPLLLSLAGDKSDNIVGIKNIGYTRAYNLIIKYKLPYEVNEYTELPDEIRAYKDQIIKNYKLTSFDEQIKRIDIMTLETVKNKVKEIW